MVSYELKLDGKKLHGGVMSYDDYCRDLEWTGEDDEDIDEMDFGPMYSFSHMMHAPLFRDENLSTSYVGQVFVFDDPMMLKGAAYQEMLDEADDISANLSDVFRLAKSLYGELKKQSGINLKTHPIIIVSNYYSKEFGFSVNSKAVNMLLNHINYVNGICGVSKRIKPQIEASSAVAINLTPCPDESLFSYWEDFDKANKILQEAHEDALSNGYMELKKDPTCFACSRYMISYEPVNAGVIQSEK